MDGREFLILADALVAETSEVAWRSAVSRAYYAAFHIARLLLGDLGFAVPRAERAHAHLWLRLSNCGNAAVELAGKDLNDLRSKRNRADYDIDKPLSHGLAAGYVTIARTVVQALDAANIEPTRTQIKDAMKLYERNVLRDVTWHP